MQDDTSSTSLFKKLRHFFVILILCYSINTYIFTENTVFKDFRNTTQPSFTWSKSAMETTEEYVKSAQN